MGIVRELKLNVSTKLRLSTTTLKYFKELVRDYIKETGSKKAKAIIKNINIELKYFKLVKPINASMEDIIKNTINKVA